MEFLEDREYSCFLIFHRNSFSQDVGSRVIVIIVVAKVVVVVVIDLVVVLLVEVVVVLVIIVVLLVEKQEGQNSIFIPWLCLG